MKCPACEDELAAKTIDGITVDICGCGGIWFDNFEFKNLMSRMSPQGRSL